MPSESPPLFLRRWRHLVWKLLFLMASAVQARVHDEQLRDLRSSKKKVRLPDPDGAQEACLHPVSSHIQRGNKWARWTVCGKCKLRLSYTENDTAKRIAKKHDDKKDTCEKGSDKAAPPQGTTAPGEEMLERIAKMMTASVEATAQQLGAAMSSSLAPLRAAVENQTAQMQLQSQHLAAQSLHLAALTSVMTPVPAATTPAPMDEEVWGPDADWTLQA